MTRIIDSHAHVNFPAFDNDRAEVIARALDNDIYLVNVGSDSKSSQKAVEIAQGYSEGVYAIVGLHPTDIAEEFDYNYYLKLAKDPKTVAIGEVGLDYHHFKEGDDIEALKVKQKEIFIKFIDLAGEVGKPLMIHCWDAYDDLLEILKTHPSPKQGIVHSFVGGFRMAKRFIELGFYIGLNGVVTYTADFNRLIKEVPLEWIVVETDCPYLAPGAKKGERNEPLLVREVVAHIAEIKGLDIEEVARQTTENAKKVLRI